MALAAAPAPIMVCLGFFVVAASVHPRIERVTLLVVVCLLWSLIGICCGEAYGIAYGWVWAQHLVMRSDAVAGVIGSMVYGAVFMGVMGGITGIVLAVQCYHPRVRPRGVAGTMLSLQATDMVSGAVSAIVRCPMHWSWPPCWYPYAMRFRPW